MNSKCYVNKGSKLWLFCWTFSSVPCLLPESSVQVEVSGTQWHLESWGMRVGDNAVCKLQSSLIPVQPFLEVNEAKFGRQLSIRSGVEHPRPQVNVCCCVLMCICQSTSPQSFRWKKLNKRVLFYSLLLSNKTKQWQIRWWCGAFWRSTEHELMCMVMHRRILHDM